MSNFSQKSQVIIESFQKDRGELPVQQSEELVEFKSLMKDYIRYRIMNEQFGGPVQLTASPTKKKIDPNNVTELLGSLKQGESVKSGAYKGLGRGALARLAQMETGTDKEKEKAAEYGKERELHRSVEDVRKAGESRWFDVTKEGEVDPNELAIATDVALSAIPVGGIASGAARLALARSPVGRAVVSKTVDLIGRTVGRTPTSKLSGGARDAVIKKGLVRVIRDVENDLLKAGVKGVQTGVKGTWEATKGIASKLGSKPVQQATQQVTQQAVNAGNKSLIGKGLNTAKWILNNPTKSSLATAAVGELIPAATKGKVDPIGAISGTEPLIKQWGQGLKIGGVLSRGFDYITPTKWGLIGRGVQLVPGVTPAVKDFLTQSAAEQSGRTPEEIERQYSDPIRDAEENIIGGFRSVTGTQQQSQQQRRQSSRPSWEEFRDYFRGMDPNANEEEMRRSWERQFGGR